MQAFIGFIGFVVMLVGGLSVLKPITRFRIKSRKMGAIVAFAGLVLMVGGLGGGAASPEAAPTSSSQPESEPDQVLPTSTVADTEPEPDQVLPTSTVADTEPDAVLIPFKIVGEEDVSFADTKRIALRVTVEAGATADQVLAVAEAISMQYRESTQHDALSILFYHYEGLSEGVFTVGRYEDVPYGDWGRANEAADDYSNFEPFIDMPEKDWSKLPTPEQVAVQVAFDEVLLELDTDPLNYPSDDEVFPVVAERLGINEVTAREAMEAIIDWTFYASIDT